MNDNCTTSKALWCDLMREDHSYPADPDYSLSEETQQKIKGLLSKHDQGIQYEVLFDMLGGLSGGLPTNVDQRTTRKSIRRNAGRILKALETLDDSDFNVVFLKTMEEILGAYNQKFKFFDQETARHAIKANREFCPGTITLIRHTATMLSNGVIPPPYFTPKAGRKKEDRLHEFVYFCAHIYKDNTGQIPSSSPNSLFTRFLKQLFNDIGDKINHHHVIEQVISTHFSTI